MVPWMKRMAFSRLEKPPISISAALPWSFCRAARPVCRLYGRRGLPTMWLSDFGWPERKQWWQVSGVSAITRLGF